jgi:S1-C subfamily serine protease
MKRFGTTFATVLLSMFVGAAIVGGITWARGGNDSTKGASNSAAARSGASNVASSQGNATTGSAGSDFSALYEQVRPSIVRITTGTQTNGPIARGTQGLGSGIILDAEGHILTNYHVVTGFKSVTVTFADGGVAQADVVGTDPGDDVALIKTNGADASELKPATLGDSGTVKIGTVVAAIGNPFGLDGSFTTGVISGLDRTLSSSSDGRPIRGLLQTDAAVNPGNSGGALMNLKGEIIGINTAIENPNGNGFVGVAYAVPINTPKRFLTQLTSGKTITHARLGIAGASLTADEAKKLGVPYGVAVMTVEAGSAADAAGLQASADGTGDVILGIDGQQLKSFADLANYIDTKQVGDQVKLSVHRDGKDIEITATLKSWDSSA